MTILKLLLARGAEVNATGDHYETALAAAALGGWKGMDPVRILLAHGAFANMRGGDQAHFVNPLNAAVACPNGPSVSGADYGYPPLAQMLVEKGTQIDDIPERRRSTARNIVNPSSCSVQ
jgi:hypothetical protein